MIYENGEEFEMEHGRAGGRSMQAKVKRATLLLDKLVPGWETRIKLESLRMSSGTMCMLGQLFGADVETSIAKELHPELWEKCRWNSYTPDGYILGSRMIPKMLGLKESDIDWVREAENPDVYALSKACAGASNECFWAEEVADRLASKEGDLKDERN